MYTHKHSLFFFIALTIGILAFTCCSNKTTAENPNPFSFESVAHYTPLIQHPEYITTDDHIALATYAFVCSSPKAVIIFYHGSGAWSNGPYQHMAQELCNNAIATYLMDIRGHGNSDGPRGDAPSAQRIWEDINLTIDAIHARHPNTPIFLAGHSSGAGLLLNYSACSARRPSISGYLFLSPFLGGRSSANRTHTDSAQSFIKNVRLWAIIPHALTGERLFNNTPAIFFNYPEQIYAQDPLMLHYYTCAMARATSPNDAQALFSNLDTPFSLFIGSKDEQFLPQETLAIASRGKANLLEIIDNATHLSAIIAAPAYFNKAIDHILFN